MHSVLGLGSAQWFSLVLHSVPGLGSAQLRTTNAGPRGQTRRSVSIGEKMYTSLRCKPAGPSGEKGPIKRGGNFCIFLIILAQISDFISGMESFNIA